MAMILFFIFVLPVIPLFFSGVGTVILKMMEGWEKSTERMNAPRVVRNPIVTPKRPGRDGRY